MKSAGSLKMVSGVTVLFLKPLDLYQMTQVLAVMYFKFANQISLQVICISDTWSNEFLFLEHGNLRLIIDHR